MIIDYANKLMERNSQLGRQVNLLKYHQCVKDDGTIQDGWFMVEGLNGS